MELCSGDSPKRRNKMCKNTDRQPAGNFVSLPFVTPPIESWYVVAHNMATGACSISPSWKIYQSEYIRSSSPITPPSSPGRTEKKKGAPEDATATAQLAAFPTMSQAIAYVKIVGCESSRPSSPIASSVKSSSATNSRSGSMIAGGRTIPSNLSPDESRSSVPHDTNDESVESASAASRSSTISHPRERINKTARKIAEVIGEDDDCENDSSNNNKAAKAKSSQSHTLSDIPLKKRKVETYNIRSSIPIFPNRPLSMSKTSETIDIGAPTQHTPNTNSLDALAMAASSSGSKKAGKFQKLSQPPINTEPTTERRTVSAAPAAKPLVGTTTTMNQRTEGARLSATGLISRGELTDVTISRETMQSRVSQLVEYTMGRLPGRLSPSIDASKITALSIVNQKHQEIILLQQQLQKQKQDQEIRRLIQQQDQKEMNQRKIRTSSMPLRKAPIPLSSLKIPEVPKGFVRMQQQQNPDQMNPAIPDIESPAAKNPDRMRRAISDLKSSIDRKIMMNNNSPSVVPSMGLPSAAQTRAISNRLSHESFPLGNFHSQLQNLPQQLQALNQASLFQTSPHLLSLQLQSSRNLLNRHLLRNSGVYPQDHNLQQQHQTRSIDLTSSYSSRTSSECDHSEITHKFRNGPSSDPSSPNFRGTQENP